RQYPRLEKVLKGEEVADRAVSAPYDEGKMRLSAATPISSIGWAVTAATREEDVTGPILSSIYKSALLFLFVSFAAFFIALAVSRKITSPVAALRSHALALGHGEVPEQVKINHILEFQDLADAFNTMAEKVRAREMDLRESEHRESERAAELEAIFVAHNDATLVYDAEMNVRLVTPSFFTIYGFDPVGLNVREIIQRVSCRWLDGRPFKLEEQPTPRALAGEKVTGAIFTVKRADGTAAVVETSSGPICMGDQITGSVTVWQDITERKQAEMALKERTAKLEEINKELESFSYSISHDLRAPLRAIDGYARMLLKKHGQEFDEDSMRKFNDIRSNSQMMGKLIDDILTLSRLGRAKMSIVDLDMEGIITDVWKELQTINPERNMSLTIQAMPSGYGDRTLIRQVYANLLGNAVKFTKYKNPAQIEAGGYTDGDDHVYYIKDNGIGFDMAYYDKLFGIFQRLHNNPDFEGTGVGLATIQRAVHRHGGRVLAEGKVNEGATFYFSLPS
ncbi:MAG: sensor histidine kinase, partial [Syntrophales bacterium]